MSQPGLVDYHLHTAVTVDAHATEAGCCQRAVALGLGEIAFTNHVMLLYPDYTISPEELVEHWAQIQACQQRYPELTIRLGLEMDYYEGREDDIAATILRYEDLIGRRFDFILGAIHHLNGVRFSSSRHAAALFNDHEVEAIYHDFFVLMAKAARSDLFDVMAHPDLIKKYTGKLYPPVPFDRYRAPVEAFIESLLEAGVGIELNLSGLKRSVAEIYPSDQLLSLYLSEAKARGVEPIVTIGSDAHRVEDVGAYLSEGVKALRRAGHNTITLFERREQITFRLW
jgi:histidinol-phosphatase (PHP family)